MSEHEVVSGETGSESAFEGNAASNEAPSMKKAVANAALKGSVALGKGAVAYFKKLCGIRDPKAALAETDAQLAAIRNRLEPRLARYEELYSEIAAMKKMRESASPAKRKMLDMKLRSSLAEYKSIERQVSALYRKEEMVVAVQGRRNELVVQGLPMPRTEDVDRLADELKGAINTDEDLEDAVIDLDNIDIGHEHHTVNLDEELAEFDEDQPGEEVNIGKAEVNEDTIGE